MDRYEFIIAVNIIVIIVLLICLSILFHKKIRTSDIWHATVTPLASIIGSGFLVSAPLLLLATGSWAVLVMIAIVSIAYFIGASLRFNIMYAEPLLNKKEYLSINLFEGIAKPALGIAYIISVTFYLKLLSAFAFRGFHVHNLLFENILTTTILLVIGLTGKLRGLSMLEILETYSVNIKLSIIMAVTVSLFMYNGNLVMHSHWRIHYESTHSFIKSLREVFGMLIIVQGFETSRYLGHAYDAQMRIKTMRYAQWISAVIYVVFVALTSVVFNHIHTVTEVTIIQICKIVAPVLPILLIIAAVMSQFSAAIADTIGSGGLLSEATRHKLSVNNSYLLIAVLAIGLTWLANIYQVITIASKAFAIYYALQIVICILTAFDQKGLKYKYWHIFANILLLTLLLTIIIFGIPVE